MKQESALGGLWLCDLMTYLVGRYNMSHDLCFSQGEDGIIFRTVITFSGGAIAVSSMPLKSSVQLVLPYFPRIMRYTEKKWKIFLFEVTTK